MLDHVGVNVSDYERSREFYQGALAPLGFSLLMESVPGTGGFGSEGKPWFWITDQREPTTENVHVALERAAMATASCDSRADQSIRRQELSAVRPAGKAVQDALYRARLSDPHWYLATLGTDPRAQGKGVGSALVRSGLERSDREGAHAYLECMEHLVLYYERFGFEMTGEIEMPEDVPDQVSMWRARC
jgi:predicted N-acetyltransferase YhbS